MSTVNSGASSRTSDGACSSASRSSTNAARFSPSTAPKFPARTNDPISSPTGSAASTSAKIVQSSFCSRCSKSWRYAENWVSDEPS